MSDARLIPLWCKDGSVSAHVIVDESLFEQLNRWRWHLGQDGYARRKEYVAGRQHTIRLHRVVLGLAPGEGGEVDHRNLNKLDNRRSNLRMCPRGAKDNGQNKPRQGNNTSGYRGVTWHRGCGKWQAVVKLNGRSRYLGLFDSAQEAAKVAASFRAKHMPFAADAGGTVA